MQAWVALNFNSVFTEYQRVTKEPHVTDEKPYSEQEQKQFQCWLPVVIYDK